MGSELALNVACTLIPIQGYNLLLPNRCIAEVLMRTEIEKTSSHLPWHLGQVDWYGEKLPIISVEKLESKVQLVPKKKFIIVVIQCQINNAESAYFGILANHIPQVTRANDQSLDREINPQKTHQYAMSYLNINGKSALIPDIQRMAKSLPNRARKSA